MFIAKVLSLLISSSVAPALMPPETTANSRRAAWCRIWGLGYQVWLALMPPETTVNSRQAL